jgi:hypothetical protein
MHAFEPLINLLLLMGALSTASERLTNAIKLRYADLRERRQDRREEKDRERRIAQHALATSIALAVVLKADFFQILSHLQAPWDTLGWARPAAGWTGTAVLQTLGGTIVTGISLGFGSKFWHDLLDLIYGARTTLRRRARPRSHGHVA